MTIMVGLVVLAFGVFFGFVVVATVISELSRTVRRSIRVLEIATDRLERIASELERGR